MSGKILVTGSPGFIGSRLCVALADAGHTVRAATRRPDAIRRTARIEPALVGDFGRPIDWSPLLDGIDSVVHLAGIAHQDPGKVPAADYQRINVDATAELVQQAHRAGVRHLVLMSSISAQAEFAATDIVTEEHRAAPAGPYGRSKLAAEAAVRDGAIDHTILRPVVVYGPGVRGNVASLLRIADTPWPLPLGAFRNRRSLLALDNLMSAVAFVLSDARARDQTFVVADPSALTLAEIVCSLRTALGRSPRLLKVPPAAFRTALALIGRSEHWKRIGGSLVASPAKLVAAGWRPVIDTPDGLAQFALAANRTTS